jgi:hypothetical protein
MMTTTPTALTLDSGFPPLDGAVAGFLTACRRFDPVATGSRVISILLTITAFVHVLFLRALPSIVRWLRMLADRLETMQPLTPEVLDKLTVKELRVMYPSAKGKTKAQLISSILFQLA